MKILLKKCGLLLFTAATFIAYTNFVNFTPWPNVVVKVCGAVDGAEVCRASYTYYFWLYAGFCIGYMWLALRTRDILRPTALLALGLALFVFVQRFTFSEVSHIQTYSYEAFIVGFYSWMAWLVMSLVACFLWSGRRRLILKYALLVTLVMTVFFAFAGRGSSEHINPLVGGLLIQQNLEMAKLGVLWKLLAVILAACVAYNPPHHLVHWIQHGKLDFAVWKRSAVLAAAMVTIAALPLLSLPAGIALNDRDIAQAKDYADRILPKLEEYYNKHKQYPDTLDEVGEKLNDEPRLLNIYDYLAYNTRGGFYLSRPEKYCFIFPNPGSDFGFWSRTSSRGWRFVTPRSSLEQSYEDVCDENTDDIHQHLIAGHLGIDDESDDSTRLAVEAGQAVPMQRQTQAVTPRLQQAIDELGYKDPDIYYKAPRLPKGAELSPDKLLEELKKQPLRSD